MRLKKKNKIFLHPSEVMFFDKPAVISTLLGSCVAVAMFDRESGTAAICHALLPYHHKNRYGKDPKNAKFVDSAISEMLTGFRRRGIKPENLEVKLFGGAFAGVTNNPAGSFSVGKRNIEAALRSIKREGLRLKAKDTGGAFGRKVLFSTGEGDVWIRRFNTVF